MCKQGQFLWQSPQEGEAKNRAVVESLGGHEGR